MKRPMIYVAGPISTGGDIPGNTHQGVMVAEELRRVGFITFCPHLSVFTEMVCGSRPWQEWIDYDEEVILRCDALYRMPGASRGADHEEAFCRERGIPVFKSLGDLIEWRDRWVATHPDKRALDRLQAEIGAWGDKTFPQSTANSVLKHFQKESGELLTDKNAVEAADCTMLIMHFAHKMRFSLLDAIRQKFEINKARTWGKPDADGVVEHVRS
jgi:hypothetical protein